MPLTTPLHGYHAEHSHMTEFAGYEMPLWYTTTSDEHMAVRNGSGIFDVSHMGRAWVDGPGAAPFIETLVPTNVASQAIGKAFYTLLLNDKGGIIDDLIITRVGEDRFLFVVNAANAAKDLNHVRDLAPAHGVEIEEVTTSTAMIAVQGPRAAGALQPLTELDLAGLKRFRSAETKVAGEPALISRTGYTGEDGFEVIVFGPTVEEPNGALMVWNGLLKSSSPCGLGARDSLRLEAGFPLHGSDIDESTDPYEADLAWVVSPGKAEFVGSGVLSQRAGKQPDSIRRGLVLAEGIPRHGFEVQADGVNAGRVTSGTFSPLLRKGVALCMVDAEHSVFGTTVDVVVRGSPCRGSITKPPFYDERLYGWKRQSNGN